MRSAVHFAQLILEGNIEAIIIVSIALAVVIGLFIHIYILPDRKVEAALRSARAHPLLSEKESRGGERTARCRALAPGWKRR